MLNMCVENYELKILSRKYKIPCWKDGWVDGWVGGWMDGGESRVKDCLQQSKMNLDSRYERFSNNFISLNLIRNN